MAKSVEIHVTTKINHQKQQPRKMNNQANLSQAEVQVVHIRNVHIYKKKILLFYSNFPNEALNFFVLRA